MAMNFGQLRAAFETYTNTHNEASDAQLALWMNEALLDLAYELGPVRYTVLEVQEGDTLAANGDWLRLLCCDVDFARQPDGSLLFLEAGSGKLYYRGLPSMFSGADDEQSSDLHAALHYLPALFAASRYWDSECDGDSGESALAARWLNFYYAGKNLARARLNCAAGDIGGWTVA